MKGFVKMIGGAVLLVPAMLAAQGIVTEADGGTIAEGLDRFTLPFPAGALQDWPVFP